MIDIMSMPEVATVASCLAIIINSITISVIVMTIRRN